ncbi:uncharacterized protein MONOS_7981 [Monocercomonoides exilis]|uniref:uncharacterized protein n=1 Tax=Monocercomonoides exilis TaxID=2049356 RepID=UPI003559C832|nr:hypothetical protein MONOS_7981 [Monocercomonoides exilis]|eukprot:MONOS_7981.1-p1 / transcript=MONOS_7981.1 / gene=MONOS_7981 / organism=Monocercomonoides_exilis_PA203 / gene_product=unspecified product / transcript_product=unspecified product / location=Mono_scaffold00289:21336-21834(-) / protein_length=134 / sequence_SO=supercontig / SO=protein_coding / is_pseudo=false
MMGGIERWIPIVALEEAVVFAPHMPLSLQLLRGYIVAKLFALFGGVVCSYDVVLSVMLSVQLVVQLPLLAMSVGKKSGRKRVFFEACGGEAGRRSDGARGCSVLSLGDCGEGDGGCGDEYGECGSVSSSNCAG